MLDLWRRTWREAIAPHLSTVGLEALAVELRHDGDGLVPGVWCNPPPDMAPSCEPTCACPVAFALWKGEGIGSVGQLQTAVDALCEGVDRVLGEPNSIRWFADWVDGEEWEEVRRQLLGEVDRELDRRRAAVA